MAAKNQIRGIIFDVGGVLVGKFDSTTPDLYEHIGKIIGISPAKIKQAARNEGGALQAGEESSLDFWKRIIAKLKVPCPKNRVLTTLFAKTYNTRINKKTFAIVRRLKKDYPLGILSNTIKEHVEINKKRKIYKLFETVVHSCDVGLRKPQKEIYELAARRMRIPPENLLFIDDKIVFVKGARAAGLNAIVFKSPEQLKISLKKFNVFLTKTGPR